MPIPIPLVPASQAGAAQKSDAAIEKLAAAAEDLSGFAEEVKTLPGIRPQTDSERARAVKRVLDADRGARWQRITDQVLGAAISAAVIGAGAGLWAILHH